MTGVGALTIDVELMAHYEACERQFEAVMAASRSDCWEPGGPVREAWRRLSAARHQLQDAAPQLVSNLQAAEAELNQIDTVLGHWPVLSDCASRTDAVVLACCLEGQAREEARHLRQECDSLRAQLDKAQAELKSALYRLRCTQQASRGLRRDLQ